MKTSLRSANVYRNVMALNLMTKHADLMSEEMLPQKNQQEDAIYDDLELMGQAPVQSEMDYLSALEGGQGYGDQGYGDQGYDDQGYGDQMYGHQEPYFGNLTPSEFMRYFSDPQSQMGYQLGYGANRAYDDLYDPRFMKYSSEKKASILNEIVKIGMANFEIQKKMESNDKEQVKVAKEMNRINKDYLSNMMGKLLGVGNE